MSALDVNYMKRNGLWTERIAEVNEKGFSTASSIARLIYSCETGNGIDQHAAEDLKYVSALIETQAAELLKLRETLLEIDSLLSGSLPVTKQVKELIAELNLNEN